MAALSDGGLRRSEAWSLTWGDVQRWDDGKKLSQIVSVGLTCARCNVECSSGAAS